MEGITALEDVVGRWEVHLISVFPLIFSSESFERKRADTVPGFFRGFFGSGASPWKTNPARKSPQYPERQTVRPPPWLTLKLNEEAHTMIINLETARIARELKKLSGITVKIDRSWLWVTGDTRIHKEILKSLGLRWSKKRTAWYYKGQPAATEQRLEGINLLIKA